MDSIDNRYSNRPYTDNNLSENETNHFSDSNVILNSIFLKIKETLHLNIKSSEKVISKVTHLLKEEDSKIWLESKEINEIFDLALKAGIINTGQPKNEALHEILEKISQLNEDLYMEIFSAIIEDDFEKILEFANSMPQELKNVMNMQDEQGKTPLHWAATHSNIKLYELFENLSPKKFKQALLTQDDEGLTPLHEVFWENNLGIAAFIGKKAPNEFQAAIKIPNHKNETLLHWGISEGIDFLKLMIKIAPEQSKELLFVKDSEGMTPFHIAAQKGDLEVFQYIQKKFPYTIQEAICIQDKEMSTLVHSAVQGKNLEILKLFFEIAPDTFNLALRMADDSNQIPIEIAFSERNLDQVLFLAQLQKEMLINEMKKPKEWPLLHSAVNQSHFELLEFMHEIAPDEFKRTLMVSNKQDGDTLLHFAILRNNYEFVKFFADKAPEEFKLSMSIENFNHETPLTLAIFMNEFDLETLKLMLASAPDAALITNLGETSLAKLRRIRPKNYSKTAKILKENSMLDAISKEYFRRKAVAHALHISGTSSLLKSASGKYLGSFELQGHSSTQWFHLLSKDLDKFMASYPNLLNVKQFTLLKESLKFAANSQTFSPEEKLNRIKQDLPTILNGGFEDHDVTLVIWGNQFVICNRGEGSRIPIDIFHFTADQLTVEDIKKIEEIFIFGNVNDYQQLFFETLYQKLNFSKTPLDRNLQNALFLPKQRVGNCSFISPITGIYSLFLLESIRSKPISEESLTSRAFDEQMQIPVLSYQTWLGFQQITILEKLINPVKDLNSLIEVDHGLILNALHNAHQLPLDPLCQKKLDDLVRIYYNSLTAIEKEKVKTQIVYWHSLAKESFLYR